MFVMFVMCGCPTLRAACKIFALVCVADESFICVSRYCRQWWMGVFVSYLVRLCVCVCLTQSVCEAGCFRVCHHPSIWRDGCVLKVSKYGLSVYAANSSISILTLGSLGIVWA